MLAVLRFHGALTHRIATDQRGVGSAVHIDVVGSSRTREARRSNVEGELAVLTALFRLNRRRLDRVDAACHTALQAYCCPVLIEGGKALIISQTVRFATIESAQQDLSVSRHSFVANAACLFLSRMD